jgi:hypothetical protein
MSAAPAPLEKKSIVFENGRSAEILPVRQASQSAKILAALDIPEVQAAILVGGSRTPFQSRLHNRLLDLVSRGVAQAALECDTLILDEGTRDGASGIIGQGVADRGHGSKLVGVLPPGKAREAGEPAQADASDLDTNHTHFVLLEEDKLAGQAQVMRGLAEAASKNKDWIITILLGGELEGSSLDLALETVRRGWPLLVIEDSGPLADEIVKIKKEIQAVENRTGRVWRLVNSFSSTNSRLSNLRETNPRLYEIISDGRITIIGTGFDAIQLRNLIKAIFTHPPQENILWTAWQRFAEYDQNSVRHRKQWRWLKNVPLILGVVSTLVVLVYSAAEIDQNTVIGEVTNRIWTDSYVGFMSTLSTIRANPVLDLIFRFSMILLPIATSLILGIETRLKLGSKYILLRGAAEAVKRGIYSYRVLNKRSENAPEMILPYNEPGLATHLSKISKLLLESDVNEAAFTPYEGSIPPNMFGAEAYDDGFSPLDPETYLKIRVGDQLKFYTLRTNQYEKRIRQLQYLMLIFGGLGTFLAAIGAQYWLPLTAGIVSAVTAYLEYQQLEQILTKYNLTKSSLENARATWLALPEDERYQDKNIQRLVRDVEAILESENQGWVQYVNQVQEEDKG